MNKSKRWIGLLVGTALFSMCVHADEFVPIKPELPLQLYGDCDEDVAPAYVPSGWMGRIDSIEMDQCWDQYPHSGDSCIKVTYSEPRNWGGIVWSDPPNDWGNEPGGWDLSEATNLSFWARGEKGGERVEFKCGILRGKRYSDSGFATTGRIKLTDAWKQYNLPLDKKNLKCIKTGFVWVVLGQRDPVTFYIDDLQYE
ncbi:MAG: hypothetical protein EOM20_17700 [Spartobacteria bacterium]|nr:hypothetical protein [Spartobacteria bacterium]